MRRFLPLVLLAAASTPLATGCSGLDSAPLDPVRSEAEFRVRRLDDPGLLGWLEANRVSAPSRWTLETLTLAAFYFHPELDVARARLLAARGAATTAAALPNPVLHGDLEKVMSALPAGASPWVYGAGLEMPLDFLWKRGYRIAETRAQIDVARLELGETAWAVRHRLRAALLDDLLIRRSLDLRREDLDLRSELVAAAVRLLASGETSRLELDRARGDQAAARVAFEDVKGRAASTRATLASAVGVPVRALEGVAIDWPGLETLPQEAALPLADLQQASLLNRLDVRRELAAYAAAEAALGLELAKRYPDVTLGPGYLYDQGDRKFTIGLSISLPIFNQNGGPIAEAEARRQEAAARFLAVQARAIGDLEQAIASYRGARNQLAALDLASAAVTRRLDGVRRALELGEADRVSLLGVQAERTLVESGRIEALRRSQEALGALEDALQRPLGGSGRAFEAPESAPRKEKP
jgi:outer membrane protein TolC